MTDLRKILHIDMDAFYASVEQRDRPELRGRPVCVGGDPSKRGVVAACSYEARRYGIHSAMPGRTAYHRCPHAVFVRPRFEVYRAVSRQIRDIFLEYTDRVEPLSLDEAFLDVTENRPGIPFATAVAKEIRAAIRRETGLTASAGVSFNKFLAKVASDLNKPDGIAVVTPAEADAFIERLPIRKFFGVGPATERRMVNLGIRNGADLRRFSREDLTRHFGKSGRYFFDIAHGRDERPVEPHRERKSLGKETTLHSDVFDPAEMGEILARIAEQVEASARKNAVKGYTVTVKVRYHDFRSVTRSRTLAEPVFRASEMMAVVPELLAETDAGNLPVRLLGITLSNFPDPERRLFRQLCLPWEDRCAAEDSPGHG
ncbi:MAG: DNA polymerase IV [Desulfococcaceae bacterium]